MFSRTGCYGDGSLCWQHIRDTLADLVKPYDPALAQKLTLPMTDDGGEEYEALDILQEHTILGCQWVFDGGDLLLVEDDYDYD